MWSYQKHLQYPIHIKNPDARAAQVIISQYGGPDGEIGASLRYLSQRYAMPNAQLAGILTDIGTEELAHLEMVGTLVCQLCRGLTPEQKTEVRRKALKTWRPMKNAQDKTTQPGNQQ